MSKPYIVRSRFSELLPALSMFALLALIIGCGGGGGGGTTTTGGPTTTSTGTSTTATTTATTTSTTTATTTGTTTATTTSTTGTTGSMLPDKIYFSEGQIDSTDFRYMDPDGTGDTLLAALPLNYAAVAPSTAEQRFAFAYSSSPDGSTGYDIYVNSTINIAGATRLTTLTFDAVSTIQYTFDGSKIVFTASANNVFGLYRMNKDGSSLTRLDDADYSGADVAMDGTDRIVYGRLTGSLGEIFKRNLNDNPGLGTRLTNNTADDVFPQWSKDGSLICWSTDRDGNLEIYKMSSSGSGATRLTNTPDDLEIGSSFSPDGTAIAFSDINTFDIDLTGVYKMSSNGTNRQSLKLVPNVNPALYWTPNGIGPASLFGGSLSAKQWLRRRVELRRRE